MHFARAASEALARIVDGLLLGIGRCKRWLNTGTLKRNPCAFEFLRWANFDDFHALFGLRPDCVIANRQRQIIAIAAFVVGLVGVAADPHHRAIWQIAEGAGNGVRASVADDNKACAWRQVAVP